MRNLINQQAILHLCTLQHIRVRNMEGGGHDLNPHQSIMTGKNLEKVRAFKNISRFDFDKEKMKYKITFLL